MKATFLHAATFMRANDLERFKKEFEDMEGSATERYKREALEELIGFLALAIPTARRLERMAHAEMMAEETRLDFASVAERSIEMANCAQVGQEKPYESGLRLVHNGKHTEISEPKGKL